jgi:hypothetical protein
MSASVLRLLPADKKLRHTCLLLQKFQQTRTNATVSRVSSMDSACVRVPTQNCRLFVTQGRNSPTTILVIWIEHGELKGNWWKRHNSWLRNLHFLKKCDYSHQIKGACSSHVKDKNWTQNCSTETRKRSLGRPRQWWQKIKIYFTDIWCGLNSPALAQLNFDGLKAYNPSFLEVKGKAVPNTLKEAQGGEDL